MIGSRAVATELGDHAHDHSMLRRVCGAVRGSVVQRAFHLRSSETAALVLAPPLVCLTSRCAAAPAILSAVRPSRDSVSTLVNGPLPAQPLPGGMILETFPNRRGKAQLRANPRDPLHCIRRSAPQGKIAPFSSTR
jgi:hypothetical protein